MALDDIGYLFLFVLHMVVNIGRSNDKNYYIIRIN